MRSKLIHEHAGQRTFAVILETGDEAMSCLTSFANREQLGGSQITAIGAFRDAVLGYFDWERKEYTKIPVAEQVEVLSFVGGVATKDDTPALHVHVVLGRSDGTTLGGHLIEGRVRPTLEVIVTESPRHLQKQVDPESGLALIRP